MGEGDAREAEQIAEVAEPVAEPVGELEYGGSVITRWLAVQHPGVFSVYATFAAFATYFCMYAFRKPFAVGKYEGAMDFGFGPIDTKVVFIIAQVFGYTISKFLGIKVVSELTPARRAGAIVVAIALAEVGLVLFGVLPRPWNALGLFLNGLPLGMVWGLVFGFLEGRRTSDVLGAGLCVSFIVASGFVKSVGKWLLGSGVPEVWMPSATGAIFLLPILLFIFLLSQLPQPSKEDEEKRMKREPMDGKARARFFVALAPGLVILVFVYMLLSAYRDFRDNFAREIWDALGYADEPEILTMAELPVALGALAAVALVFVIKDNRQALLWVHALLLLGALLIGVSTLLWQLGVMGPATWMICVGLGLYVGYVPYNCVLFDRLIPAVGFAGTAGFLIYVADSFGYLGSVGLLLYKNFGHPNLSWLGFFKGFSYVTSVLAVGLFVVSALYFNAKTQSARGATQPIG